MNEFNAKNEESVEENSCTDYSEDIDDNSDNSVESYSSKA